MGNWSEAEMWPLAGREKAENENEESWGLCVMIFTGLKWFKDVGGILLNDYSK